MGLKKSTFLNRTCFPRQVACCHGRWLRQGEKALDLSSNPVPFYRGCLPLVLLSLIRGRTVLKGMCAGRCPVLLASLAAAGRGGWEEGSAASEQSGKRRLWLEGRERRQR